MEIIKKTILQALTTGTTVTGDIIITGNTGVTYNIKIKLFGIQKDIGFFDAYTMTGGYQHIVINDKFYSYLTGGTTYDDLDFATSTGIVSGTINNGNASLVVTGSSTSRLSELRKYTITTVFANQYITGGTYVIDGVDVFNSNPPEIITYFIGGIRYVDVTTGDTSGTTFSFTAQGTNSLDFINLPIYKDPKKDNIISNPKIVDDVFIVRQELSAFDKNYKLEYIKNLNDLLTYAGGKFFNIINNA